MKKVIFTGGGSGGHVVPALTIIDELKDMHNMQIIYIGSKKGIESKLTRGKVDQYHSITTGKLRRYLSIQNFIDLFKVSFGMIQAFFILLKHRPTTSCIVSMGGFVCVPVVLAGWLLRYKLIVHEQTTRVGLANKIASKFASTVFVSFEESLKYFPEHKVLLSGYPVRKEFLNQKIEVSDYLGFNLKEPKKPILFVTGGGNGSKLLNDKVREVKTELEQQFDIIHQVGSAFISEYKELETDAYKPVEFVGSEIIDVFKCATIVLSRSGAGTVAELMALGKSSIFVPLKIAQKNEQYHNAMAAHNKNGAIVIEEDKFKESNLLEIISSFKVNKVESNENNEAVEIISNRILEFS